jgi:hypothetical protein
MQIRQIRGLPLKYYYDDLLHIGYLKFLSLQQVETLKLPTNPTNYKYTHLLAIHYVLNLEVVKTRKNWVLKSILDYHTLFKPTTYLGFVKESELVNLILSYTQEEQETDLGKVLIEVLQDVKIESLDLNDVEKLILNNLGFHHPEREMYESKRDSGLI